MLQSKHVGEILKSEFTHEITSEVVPLSSYFVLELGARTDEALEIILTMKVRFMPASLTDETNLAVGSIATAAILEVHLCGPSLRGFAQIRSHSH